MGGDGAGNRLLQLAAQGRGHARALVISVDVEPVQITAFVDIPKACNAPVFYGHQAVVSQKGTVPGIQVRMASAQALSCSFV